MTDEEFWPREPGAFFDDAEPYLAADLAARRIAAESGVPAPSDRLRAAAGLASARAALMDDYAQHVTDTRARLTGIAARTALARLEARGEAPPGDPGAQQAVDLANLRGRAEAEETAEDAERRSADLAAGHGSALGGFGPLASTMRLGGGAQGVHRAAHYGLPGGAPDDLDLRLRELCGAVTGPARDWTRLAVGAVVDEAGRPWTLIGTTELDGYLRPGVVLRDGELAAGNEAWPELSIATFCAAHGFAPGPVLGTVEPPDDVCDHLRALGFHPSWTPNAWETPSWEGHDAPVG